MPHTVYYTATTLDGYLADDQDSLDWLFAVRQDHDGFPAFIETIGTIVEGSMTYEWVLDHEDLIAHPEKWPAYYGSRPTWVFTSRDLPAVPGADIRFRSGAVTGHWDDIVASANGRDVWIVGGGDLAGQFADAGLLDRVQLSVAPATLGSGRPLLPRRIESDRLQLESVAQNGQFAELTYAVLPRGAS